MASNSNVLSTLLFIETIAKHLTESHLFQQYENKEQGPILTKLIDTAFRHLEQCVDILRPCAPISRLPNDILGLIFHAAQDEDWATSFRSTSERQSNYIPLTLSQVSRSWRDISTNLPLLWTTVKIYSPWHYHAVKTSLSMSKSLPIELKITDCDTPTKHPLAYEVDHDAEEQKHKIFCDILAPHIPRCRSIFVSIQICIPYLHLVMLDEFKHVDAFMLETLSITSQDCSPSHVPHLFDDAPLLSDIRLNVSALITGCPSLDNVTSLYLTGVPDICIYPQNLFDVLLQCTALEELYLYNEVLYESTEAAVETYSLPDLCTLHFYGASRYTRCGVLSRMTAPSLDHILFTPFSHQDAFVEKLLTQHGPATQRFPSLTTLSLMVNDVSGNWFGDVGACFPEIENLVLGGASGGLTSGSPAEDQSTMLLPNLRSLSLRDMTETSEDELCNFFALRKAAGLMLPNISLNSASLANMRHLDWLKAQVEVTECDPWLDELGRSKVVDNPEFSYKLNYQDE